MAIQKNAISRAALSCGIIYYTVQGGSYSLCKGLWSIDEILKRDHSNESKRQYFPAYVCYRLMLYKTVLMVYNFCVQDDEIVTV